MGIHHNNLYLSSCSISSLLPALWLHLPGTQGVDQAHSRRGIALGQRTMPPDGGAQIRELRMDVDPVRCPRSGDLPKAETSIQAVEIIFSPAAPSASHLLQQLDIAIGHTSMSFSLILLPPAPPPPEVARTSSPWRGTAR